MAEGKKTFVFYSDWINMVRELDDEDAGGLLKHILAYVNDENPTTDNKLIKVVFAHMKPILKKDLKKWEGIREIRKELGKKGGQAKAKQNIAKAKQPEAVNVNVNVNDNKTTLTDRIGEFKNSLRPFLGEYGKEMLIEFFEYWTEHGQKDRKFRAEKEKSFSVERRLKTWAKNQKRFEKEKSSAKKEKVNAGTIAKQKIHGSSTT